MTGMKFAQYYRVRHRIDGLETVPLLVLTANNVRHRIDGLEISFSVVSWIV